MGWPVDRKGTLRQLSSGQRNDAGGSNPSIARRALSSRSLFPHEAAVGCSV